MLKKKNNLLILLFSGLLIISLILVYFGDNDKSFNENLVQIDSASVNRIEIFPKSESGRKIILKKFDSLWKVKLKSGKFVIVPTDKINGVISPLLNLHPDRIIGRGKELFTKYQIDESATHVKLWSANELLCDVYIGKFFFSQPRNVSSCIRLADEDIIYEVGNILSMQYDQNENFYRNNNLVADDYTMWKKLVFIYPNDSSFQLSKRENNKWFADNIQADSAKVQNYLMSVQRISSTDFIDDLSVNESMLFKKILIIKQDNSQIILKLYNPDNLMIIKSSLNDESYFDGLKSGLYKNIFRNRKYFLSN